MRFPLVLALSSVLLLAGSAGASSHGSQAGATATAYGGKIVSAQGSAISTSVSAPPDAVGYGSGFAYPSDGSVLTTGPLSVSASTDLATNARSTAASSGSPLSDRK